MVQRIIRKGRKRTDTNNENKQTNEVRGKKRKDYSDAILFTLNAHDRVYCNLEWDAPE